MSGETNGHAVASALSHNGGHLVAQAFTPTCGHQYQRVTTAHHVLDDLSLRPPKSIETKNLMQHVLRRALAG